MRRPITITVEQNTLDQIRASMQAAGLHYHGDEAQAGVALNIGLRVIAGNYAKLAEISQRQTAQRPEPMVTPASWEGALGERQAS